MWFFESREHDAQQVIGVSVNLPDLLQESIRFLPIKPLLPAPLPVLVLYSLLLLHLRERLGLLRCPSLDLRNRVCDPPSDLHFTRTPHEFEKARSLGKNSQMEMKPTRIHQVN